MSFNKKAETFGKKYRKMQNAGVISNETLVEALSSALRNAVGYLPSAPKVIASRIHRNPRTVRNWLDRHNAPGAAELIELMREFDEVHQEVLRLANRNSTEPAGSIHQRIEKAMRILGGDDEGTTDRISQLGSAAQGKE